MEASDNLRRDAQALLALKSKWSARRGMERCELCSRDLEKSHPHLVDITARRIVCACNACSLLFEGSTTARYRRIPPDIIRLSDFVLDDLEWSALSIPIGLAFFFFSSVAGKVIAMYPSPAGATESLLDLDAWSDIATRHSRIQQLRPDVEALLVNRLCTPAEYFIVPIDRCYQLAGTIRKHWTGFSGGDVLWREVNEFFEGLRHQSIASGVEHARSAI